MNKYQPKAAALLVAIMIVAVLSITITGFMHLTNWTSAQAGRNFNDMRLFWAAESGANHALKWIKRLKGDYFGNPANAPDAEDHFNTTDSLKTITFYEGTQEITVHLSLGYDDVKNEWSVKSRAVQSNGEDVTIKLKAIKAVNPARFSWGQIHDHMYDSRRFHDGDTFGGEFYSSGGLNFRPDKDVVHRPRFYGKVSLSKKCWPDRPTGTKSWTTYGSSFNINWMLNNPMFANCLKADYGTPVNTKPAFDEAMQDIFRRGVEVVDEMDPTTGICYSFEELRTAPGFNKTIINGSSSSREINFKVVGGVTQAIIDGDNAHPIIVGSGAGQYNTFLVTGKKEITVGGTVSADVCVATEKNAVVIKHFIKYSNITYPSTIDTTAVKKIQRDIKAQSTTPKFSILAGVSENAVKNDGHIYVKAPSKGTRANPTQLYICASLYSPHGEYNNKQNYGEFVNPVLIGSVINYDKGGWHLRHAEYGDFKPWFYDDLRFKENGSLPLGYLNAAGTGYIDDQVNILESGYNWEVTW